MGTYKSFVEPFTRNQASPEAKEADQVLANDLWATWRTAVQRERQELDVAATLASWFGVSATELPLVMPNIGNYSLRNVGFV